MLDSEKMAVDYFARTEPVAELLDLGQQPVSNRFLKNPQENEYLYPMKLNLCEATGLIQINDPVPAAELAPRYDWITYNEPEGHLDDLVENIIALSGLNNNAKIGGISFKDDTTLERFNKKGFKHTWRIDPKEDLGIEQPGIGIETIQAYLTADNLSKIIGRRGKSDILIVRHILEHAHDPVQLLEVLKGLTTPNGYIVFEVPDCMQALEICDYTTIWEEHTIYFTPATFRNCFSYSRLSLKWYRNYPYPFENSLIAIVQSDENIQPVSLGGEILQSEILRARNFAKNLEIYKEKLQKFFKEFKEQNGKIALFGAGHLACTFVNILDIKDYIECVVDDHPQKKGLFMPGSKLEIRGSQVLLEKNIKLCLLSLNPLSEKKVIANNQSFVRQGGEFASIFGGSSCALEILRSNSLPERKGRTSC